MADHPLRPANHRRLGGPLPHQQANGTRTHLQAIACMQRPSLINNSEEKLMSSGISTPFEVLSQTQRQIIHALLTRAPLYSPQASSGLSRATCMC